MNLQIKVFSDQHNVQMTWWIRLASKPRMVEPVESNVVIYGNGAFEEIIYIINSNIIAGTGVCDCMQVAKLN